MRVAIIGCGLIGAKRARALQGDCLVVAVDADLNRAQRLAEIHPGCLAATDWRDAVSRDEVDLVIVATTNDALVPASMAAVEHRKHVLVEKPAARSFEEIQPLVQAARESRVTVKVGFNHRFHPGVRKAHELLESGTIGSLLYLRGRYGHGGRLGYEREWRAIPAVSGGGELLDQGVHLIDLARWFAGDFVSVFGWVATFFWQMPVEDNGFLALRTAQGQVAWLHVSCTEWKNLFSLEVFGSDGKLQVDGLGGSYGVERLTLYRMLPQMGPPETTAWEFPGDDLSWTAEYDHLKRCIRDGSQPLGNLEDALAALRIIGEVYRR